MFIGFDYGTANCSIAVSDNGTPRLLTLENGQRLLPSMICAPTREAISEWLHRHHQVPTPDTEGTALLQRALRYNREEDIDVTPGSVQFGLTALKQYMVDQIIAEDDQLISHLRRALQQHLEQLDTVSGQQLVQQRQHKFIQFLAQWRRL